MGNVVLTPCVSVFVCNPNFCCTRIRRARIIPTKKEKKKRVTKTYQNVEMNDSRRNRMK